MLLAEERLRLVELSRRLRPDGLVTGTAGNLSVRSGDRIAVTPSSIAYDELTPASMCVVSLDGRLLDGKLQPTTELPMHLAVYRSTSAAGAVHTHSPFATAISTVLDELPAVHYLIASLGGPVRVAPYATPGSEEIARAMLEGLEDRHAVILQNHGAIAVGETLDGAYERALLLEWLCALYHRARCIGDPKLLSDEEIEHVARLMADYGRSAR